jgi:ribosomal protein S18 acetylase RimI-like enzyme
VILRPGRDAWLLRPGRDDDAADFIALVGAAWAEYPGAGLDVDGENPELRALASYFAQAGGALWAHESNGRVDAMIGTKPLGDDVWELCKVYVAPARRGTGLAAALMQTAESHARAHGARDMILWSDTKFDRAHRFYEKHGYIRHGGIRALDDASNTLEFGYLKPLAGTRILPLDVAAAGSATAVLADILRACVDEGAHHGYLPPLVPAAARAHYQSVAKAVALGERILLAAWHNGILAGSVQIRLDTPENQRHRVDIEKLAIHPACRRQGIARRLMQEAETATARLGRELVLLDTAANSAAAAMYRRLGWSEIGQIPGCARDMAGDVDVVIFSKWVKARK